MYDAFNVDILSCVNWSNKMKRIVLTATFVAFAGAASACELTAIEDTAMSFTATVNCEFKQSAAEALNVVEGAVMARVDGTIIMVSPMMIKGKVPPAVDPTAATLDIADALDDKDKT